MEFTGERFIPFLHGAIELEHLNRYYFVVSQIDLNGKIVLDIASGEGYGSKILSKYAQEVIGVDISSEAVNYANNKYQSENLKFIQGDAINIPIEDKSVDVAVSFETIEHLNKHIEMMEELKRVLKSNGILIISSPDKYHFSKLSNNKNEFHVKELYFDEFKKLIRKYFKNALFYSQKTFVGSIIALNENKQEYKKPIIIDSEGNIFEFSPMYNISICTNDFNFIPENQMVLYSHFNEIITHSDIEMAILNGKEDGMNTIRNTKAYCLGKFILKPFSLIKRQLKKLMK